MINTQADRITVTAFRWVPPFARGFVRDLRVRWALEEAGLPYRSRLIGREDQASAEYRAWQPFGQVPAFEQDGVRMFESGAIVLHIADQSEVLMPADAAGRAQVRSWLIAALNSLEPAVQQLAEIDSFHPGEAWVAQRRPQVEAFIRRRLEALAAALGARDYVVGGFSAADILVYDVMRNLGESGLLAAHANLVAYGERCAARPAFQKALRDQLADFVPDPATA